MKPNFALNITDTSIGLLHRTPQGWIAVGETPFDTPDLDEALGYLRASALGLSPQGLTTKLVLPRSQILYTEVDAPGPSKAQREAQIRAALVGRTPYEVADLVFDWWGKGPRVQVAVVARETLQEAEAFAEAHRLNPVSFVTTPDPGTFGAEPWFGTSTLAAKLLPAGEKVSRDQDPVVILTRGAARIDPKPVDAEAKSAEGMGTEAMGTSGMPNAAAEPAPPDAPPTPADTALDAALAALETDDGPEAAARLAAAQAKAAQDLEKAEAARGEAEAKAAAEEARQAADAERARLDAETKAIEMARAEAKRIAAEAERTKAAAETARQRETDLARQRDAETARQRDATERAKAALITAERSREDTSGPGRASVIPSGPKISNPGDVPEAPMLDLSDEALDDLDGPVAPAPASPALDPLPGKAPAFASRRREETNGGAPVLGAVHAGLANPAPKVALPEARPGATSAPLSASALTGTGALNGPGTLPDAGSSARAPAGQVAARPDATAPGATSPLPGPAATPAVAVPVQAAPVRATAAPDATKVGVGATKPAPSVSEPTNAPAVSPARRLAAMVTATNIPGKPLAPAKVKARPLPARLPIPDAAPGKGQASGMGTFGAKLQGQRGKPRYLGLLLTAILLVVLATVAALSSFYVSRNDTQDAVQLAIDTASTAPADTGPETAPTPQDTALSFDPGAMDPEAIADGMLEDELPDDPMPEDEALADGQLFDDTQPVVGPATPADGEIAGAAEGPETAEAPAAVATQGPTDAAPGPAPQNLETAVVGLQAQIAAQQDEISLAGTDGPPPAFDAVALPSSGVEPDAAPQSPMPPPPFGTQYSFAEDGSIRATERGVVTPEGIWLIAAQPPVQPPRRPGAAAELSDGTTTSATASTNVVAPPSTDGPPRESAAVSVPDSAGIAPAPAGTAPAAAQPADAAGLHPFTPDPTMSSRRPPGRPASATDPVQAEDDAALPPPADNARLTSLRPRLRPAAILAQGEAARKATEATQLASASTAAAAVPPTAAPPTAALPVVLSRRPAARPRDFSRAVAAAVASATRSSPPSSAKVLEPEQEDEPEVQVSARSAPRIPTKASVAKQATFVNAINLSKINLIGVYGTANNRYALVRSANGRFTKVKVGDRVDGGTVAAITTSELRYQKGGKMLSLAMPKG